MRSVVFANNGKALAVGVVLGIGALVGWRYWSTHQDSSSREVSAHYQQLTTALDASKPQTLEAVAKFANENSNTYGALASLDRRSSMSIKRAGESGRTAAKRH